MSLAVDEHKKTGIKPVFLIEIYQILLFMQNQHQCKSRKRTGLQRTKLPSHLPWQQARVGELLQSSVTSKQLLDVRQANDREYDRREMGIFFRSSN